MHYNYYYYIETQKQSFSIIKKKVNVTYVFDTSPLWLWAAKIHIAVLQTVRGFSPGPGFLSVGDMPITVTK